MYVARTVTSPPVTGPLGEKVAEQVAEAPLPDRVQGLPSTSPGPLGERLTCPLGVEGELDWSVTVTVQVVESTIATRWGRQLTLVEVGCPATTVSVVSPKLGVCS
jgi:hypothetical protein